MFELALGTQTSQHPVSMPLIAMLRRNPYGLFVDATTLRFHVSVSLHSREVGGEAVVKQASQPQV